LAVGSSSLLTLVALTIGGMYAGGIKTSMSSTKRVEAIAGMGSTKAGPLIPGIGSTSQAIVCARANEGMAAIRAAKWAGAWGDLGSRLAKRLSKQRRDHHGGRCRDPRYLRIVGRHEPRR